MKAFKNLTKLKKYFNTNVIIGIISLIIFGIIFYNNDYMRYKGRECVVLDKLTTVGRTSEFYLVLREERGIIFDIIVTPSTYSQARIGNTLVFNLSEMDIKQTTKDNLIYFFGQAIFGALFIIFLGFGLLFPKQ